MRYNIALTIYAAFFLSRAILFIWLTGTIERTFGAFDTLGWVTGTMALLCIVVALIAGNLATRDYSNGIGPKLPRFT